MRDAAGLVDRQRIHVGAQPDGTIGLPPCQGRNYPVATDIADERNTEFGKAGPDEGGRFALVQRKLGVGMKVAPPSGQPVVQRFIHQNSSLSRTSDASGLGWLRQSSPCRDPHVTIASHLDSQCLNQSVLDTPDPQTA